jgi:hypothetical protein
MAEIDAVAEIAQFAYLACPVAPQESRIPDPDGLAQPETRAEMERRLISYGIRYAVDSGFLAVPDDIGERLDRGMGLITPGGGS